jgi:nucleotide-binding universal stress UspA family protein
MALEQSAHLIGAAATGISSWVYANTGGLGTDAGLAINLNFLRERARQELQEFEKLVRATGVDRYEKRLIDDEPAGGISMQARYADLLVIGQTDLDEVSPSVAPDYPEYVLLNSGRPVLVVPYAGQFEVVGKRVLVAWDASVEAARAVTSALPLLKNADTVHLAVFNADRDYGKHGEQPGADIALYLARHNVKVQVIAQNTEIDTGNALLSLVTDMSSDLLVMGGYGHSRFREVLLGGVTRTVLDSMTIPVFMSH